MRRCPPGHVKSIGIDRSQANIERWTRERWRPDLELYCCCGIEWLRHHFGLYRVGSLQTAAVDRPEPQATAERSPRTFVYLDPPYLIESRRSRRKLYDHELSDDEHVELLGVATRLPCQVMISHYPHRLYETCLANWRSFTFARRPAVAHRRAWSFHTAPHCDCRGGRRDQHVRQRPNCRGHRLAAFSATV
jgi:hypothetical protein